MNAYDIYRKITVGITRKGSCARPYNWPSDVPYPPNKANNQVNGKISNNYQFDKYGSFKKPIKRSLSPNNIKEESSDDEKLTLLGNLKSSNENGTSKHKKKKKKMENVKTDKQKAADLEQERINHLRNVHRITVVGENPPPPLENFEQLQLEYRVSKVIVKNLLASGYNVPTPIQMQAIPAMAQGRQILACAPTGSGKTIAFLVPILHSLKSPNNSGFRALIVCPTRELAQQIFRECCWLSEGTGLRAHLIKKASPLPGKLPQNLGNKFDILVTTPNRIIYLLKQAPPVISLKSVKWLVVDESDKLFEAGVRGFRDQLAEIYKACDSADVKRAMFSATYSVHVAKWCRKNLNSLLSITIGHRNTTVDSVQQELKFVGYDDGKLLELRYIKQRGLPIPVLIFVNTKETARQLCVELIFDGINVDCIHADRTQQQRDNTVRAFREGKIWVLICTELMARGLDFKGVNLVINYDFPPSVISYIHRIGRAGRAGRPGRAITFWTLQDDRPLIRSIAIVMKESGCEVPDFLLTLEKATKQKRRKFGQKAHKRKYKANRFKNKNEEKHKANKLNNQNSGVDRSKNEEKHKAKNLNNQNNGVDRGKNEERHKAKKLNNQNNGVDRTKIDEPKKKKKNKS